MKEMVYQVHRIKEILDEGYYRDIRYVILNLGTHPTAYVENIVNAKEWNDDILDNIEVHGGFTWCDLPHWQEDKRVVYLGWDYAHCDDYDGYNVLFNDNSGKKWTTKEVLEEVHYVIDQLLELKEKINERDNL